MSGLALKFGEDTQALLLYAYDSECGVTGKTGMAPGKPSMVNKNRDYFCLQTQQQYSYFAPFQHVAKRKGLNWSRIIQEDLYILQWVFLLNNILILVIKTLLLNKIMFTSHNYVIHNLGIEKETIGAKFCPKGRKWQKVFTNCPRSFALPEAVAWQTEH